MIRSNTSHIVGMLFLFWIFTAGNLVFDFQRITLSGQKNEIILGTVYYQEEGKSIIVVESPIKQLMIFENLNWCVFYPEKNEAFLFQGLQPFQIPFLDLVLSTTREDLGLPEKGFQLKTYWAENDTLFSYWYSSSVEDSVIIKVKQFRNTLIGFELMVRDTTKITSIFEEYEKAGDIQIPTHIVSLMAGGWLETNEVSETINIENIYRNIELPDSIINFTLPKNVTIIKQ